MRSLRILALAASLLALSAGAALAKAPTASDETKSAIEFLLSYVAASDMSFIRNGTTYTAKEAVAHLRTKYNYFKAEIETPEDFIRLAGSKSELSGKPYQVKTRDGKVQNSADWLTALLNEYRSARPTPPDSELQKSAY